MDLSIRLIHMNKRLFITLGIIAAISIAVVLSISVFRDRFGFKRSLAGEWKLTGVIVDGKPAPSTVQESDIDIIYYWDDQSIIFESETFHGFDGCNDYRGDFELGAEKSLNISRIEYSLEGCPEEYVQISNHSRKMVTRPKAHRLSSEAERRRAGAGRSQSHAQLPV